MSRIDYHLQNSVMGLLGSFWSRAVTEKTKSEARALTALTANAPGLRRLDVTMQKMVTERRALVEQVRVPFLDGDFVYVGRDLSGHWRSTLGLPDGSSVQIVRRNLVTTTPRSQLLIGSNGRPLGHNLGHLLAVTSGSEGATGLESLYILPVPAALTPIVIATKDADRVLIQGIDFETGPGYIVMRESPGAVFYQGGFTVVIGTQELRLPYDFITQVNGPSFGQAFVSAYYKGSSSIASFERAAAQACGMLVLEKDDTLVQAIPLTPEITRYVFLKLGVVDVPYPHQILEPGRDYARGFIVSNGFRIMTGSSAGWLRRATGSRTLAVDGVTAVPDLYLPPGMAIAYHSDTGVGGKPHARVHMQGSDNSLLAFWRLQKNHELTTGIYLADTIGMSAESPRVALDVHALIETFYGTKLLLVLPELDGASPHYLNRLLEFVRREKPAGTAMLVALEPSGLAPAGTFEPGEDLDDVVVYGLSGGSPYGYLVYDSQPIAYDDGFLVYLGP